MRKFIFFLLITLSAKAQTRTWFGNSTSLWPNLAPNSVMFSTSGGNNLTTINGNVPGSRFRFMSLIGAANNSSDQIITRNSSGDIHISGVTIADIVAGGGGAIGGSSRSNWACGC